MASTVATSQLEAVAAGEDFSFADEASLELVASLKSTLMQDAEEKVTQHLQTVWKKGAEAALSFQREQERSLADLEATLAQFRMNHESLEATNEGLKQAVASLTGQLSLFGGGSFPSADSFQGSLLNGGCIVDTASVEAAPGLLSDALWPHMSSFDYPGLCGSFDSSANSQMHGTGADAWWGGNDVQDCLSAVTAAAAAAVAMGVEPAVAAAAAAAVGMDSVELPSFPFPYDAMGPVLPSAPEARPSLAPGGAQVFSLASALGLGSASDLDQSQAAPPQISASASSSSSPPLGPQPEDACEAFVFSLMLRVADGLDVGLVTSSVPPLHGNAVPCLRIDSVEEGGAVEAWNRQCGSSGAAERVLLPGDRIVSVNHEGDDSEAMLRELKSSTFLRLQLVRVPGTATTASSGSGSAHVVGSSSNSTISLPPGLQSPRPSAPRSCPSSPSKLRAEAIEFVPMTPGKTAVASDSEVCEGVQLPPFPVMEKVEKVKETRAGTGGSDATTSTTSGSGEATTSTTSGGGSGSGSGAANGGAASADSGSATGRSGGCRRGRRGARAGRSSRQATAA